MDVVGHYLYLFYDFVLTVGTGFYAFDNLGEFSLFVLFWLGIAYLWGCVFLVMMLFGYFFLSRAQRHEAVLAEMEEALIDILAGESVEVFRGRFSKKLMAKAIGKLSKRIAGQDYYTLRAISKAFSLDSFLMRRLWYGRKAYCLKLLSGVYVSSVFLKKISFYIHHHSSQVRMYAMRILMINSPENTGALFMSYRYPLSVWEQLFHHATFVENTLPLPDFYALLGSRNETIVLFALRMIRLFGQKKTGIYFVPATPAIRSEMWQVSAALGILLEEGFSFSPQVFDESRDIQMGILSYMAKQSETCPDDMLMYCRMAMPVSVKCHILHALFVHVEGGHVAVRHCVEYDEDPLMRDLARHVLGNFL